MPNNFRAAFCMSYAEKYVSAVGDEHHVCLFFSVISFKSDFIMFIAVPTKILKDFAIVLCGVGFSHKT